MPAVSADRRWNHNIHYQRIVLANVPAGARTALDVGCGEGTLTRALRERVPSVVGIDKDEESVALARSQGGEYALGDVLTYPFEPASFDVIGTIATLHHMDIADGLRRMAALLRPGGVLVVIGCAQAHAVRDLPWWFAGGVWHRLLKLRRGFWQHSAPIVWPPPLDYAQTRRAALRLLPGARFRRLLLFRYSLIWTKP